MISLVFLLICNSYGLFIKILKIFSFMSASTRAEKFIDNVNSYIFNAPLRITMTIKIITIVLSGLSGFNKLVIDKMISIN